MRLLFCFLLLTKLVTAGEPKPPTITLPAGSTQVDITLQRGFTALLAQVTIADKDVGLFIFDTGGHRSLIDQALADKLALPKSGNAMVSGVGGQLAASFRKIDGLKVGELTVNALTLTAVDLSALRTQLGIPIQGILGLDVWSVAPFRLELGRRQLTVFDAAQFKPPTDATPFELELIQGALWTKVVIEDKITAVAIIDSGASAPLSFDPALLFADKQLKNRVLGFVLHRGVAGQIPMGILDLNKVAMLGRTYDTIRTTVQAGRARIEKAGVAPRGVIGSVVLRPLSLTVNAAAKQGWMKVLSDDDLVKARMKEPDLLGCDELMIAAYEGRVADCESLLANGAVMNRKNAQGINALSYAMTHAREDVLKLLIAKGFPVDEKDHNGQTPLGTSLTMKMPAIEKILRAAGAKDEGLYKAPPKTP